LDRVSAPAPVIFAVENSTDGTTHFHGYRNEILCCLFRTPQANLKKHDILVEVDSQEAELLFLTDLGNGDWQTNSRLRANLLSGVHAVRLRTTSSPYSAEAKILFTQDPVPAYRGIHSRAWQPG